MQKFKQFNITYNIIHNTRNDLKKIAILINNEKSIHLKNNNPNHIYSQEFLEISAVILAYSTIEVLTKEIIYDFLRSKNTIPDVIEFVKNKIYSNNIDVDCIYNILLNFGDSYKKKLQINWDKLPDFKKYRTQINSLKNLRNSLSHSGSANQYSIHNIIGYFNSSVILLFHMYCMFKKN